MCCKVEDVHTVDKNKVSEDAIMCFGMTAATKEAVPFVPAKKVDKAMDPLLPEKVKKNDPTSNI